MLFRSCETVRRQEGCEGKKCVAPDEELSKCGALYEGETDRLDVKLIEYSRDARMRFELSFVV